MRLGVDQVLQRGGKGRELVQTEAFAREATLEDTLDVLWNPVLHQRSHGACVPDTGVRQQALHDPTAARDEEAVKGVANRCGLDLAVGVLRQHLEHRTQLLLEAGKLSAAPQAREL